MKRKQTLLWFSLQIAVAMLKYTQILLKQITSALFSNCDDKLNKNKQNHILLN